MLRNYVMILGIVCFTISIQAAEIELRLDIVSAKPPPVLTETIVNSLDTYNQILPADNAWHPFSFSFTPNSTGYIALIFSGGSSTPLQWICYDDLRFENADQITLVGFEEVNTKGDLVGWRLSTGAKRIVSQVAPEGNGYLMVASGHAASIYLPVKEGKTLIISGSAKVAAEFEHNFSVDPSMLSYVIPKRTSNPEQWSENDYVILFKGNSITRHGTNPGVKKDLGWDRECGMAASAEENDFAHLLATKIQAALPNRKVQIAFGRQDASSATADIAYQPNLVVVQTGEHSQGNAKDVAAFPEKYRQTLETVLGYPGSPQIIAIGVWASGNGGKYSGFTQQIQDAQREITNQLRIPFVSVESYALDPKYRGDGVHPGVRWHPNDLGMMAYAESAFLTWQNMNNSNK